MKPPQKLEVPLSQFNRLINHGPTILVTTHDGNRPNVMTAAWNMPCSRKPPAIAVAIGSASYTHEVLRRTRQLVINVPGKSLLEEVVRVGRTSGRSEDKFETFNITARPGKIVDAPWVAEAMGHLECVLIDGCDEMIDRFNLFLVEVKGVWAEKRAFVDGRWAIEGGRAPTLHHLGGRFFTTPGDLLEQE